MQRWTDSHNCDNFAILEISPYTLSARNTIYLKKKMEWIKKGGCGCKLPDQIGNHSCPRDLPSDLDDDDF